MKFFFIAAGFTCAAASLQAQDRSINFEHSTWAEVKAKAAKEKKVIFFDAYTTWCGPCKKMSKEVFTENGVADYFNANFINVKMDMEKGEGPQLAKAYGVKAYPTLMFIDAQGKIVTKKEGAINANEFMDYGKMSVSGESLESLTAQYNKGKRDVAFMKKYMTRMEGLRENTAAIIETYFKGIPQTKWQIAENWYFISRYVRSENSPIFSYVLKNQKAFEEKFGAEAVSDFFVTAYLRTIDKAANGAFPVEDVQELKERFHAMNFTGAGKLELECDAVLAKLNRDTKAYIDVKEAIFSKYPEKEISRQIMAVGSVCWDMLNQSSDPYVLNKATKLAELAMQVQDPEFMDVYARLLFETGNVAKAIEVEEKVVAMLKARPNADVSLVDCEARLEKFNRKKS